MADLTRLRDLNGSREDWRIRVNLTRVWLDANTKDLCFTLQDIFGDRIGGSSVAILFHRFRDMITREGYWLDIENFRVERAPVHWKTSPHEFQISLSEDTDLEWDEEHPLVDRYSDFVSLSSIRNAVCTISWPIDLIGAITDVDPLKKWSSRGWAEPWYARSSIEFTITDDEGQSVECIAYADHADVLSERWMSTEKTYIVCALISVRVLDVEGTGTVKLDPTRSMIVYDRSSIPGYVSLERHFTESIEDPQVESSNDSVSIWSVSKI